MLNPIPNLTTYVSTKLSLMSNNSEVLPDTNTVLTSLRELKATQSECAGVENDKGTLSRIGLTIVDCLKKILVPVILTSWWTSSSSHQKKMSHNKKKRLIWLLLNQLWTILK